MDPSSVLNAETQTFGALLANGRTYVVPPFQRDYSWSEEEWEDLWYDLVNLGSDEERDGHYMGYAVLQTVDGHTFRVIDGQQRLATLSIVVLAVLRHLRKLIDSGVEAEGNEKRFQLLRSQFIGHVVASSLTTVSKLRLNKNDDDFYQSYLVNLRKDIPRLGRAKPSERLLQKASEYFYQRLERHFEGQVSGEKLAAFLEAVGSRLVFTVIRVNSELRAYKVFETLNARGVKLSSTDLLKNYLFSVVHAESPADLEDAERRWQRVTNELGSEDFPTFARHLWNASEQLTRKQALFKSIKARVKSRDEAFEFLERLERTAPLYVALGDPENPIWTREEKEQLRALRLFGVTQYYPLALAARERGIEGPQFAKLLRICVVIAFRYQVISGFNPSAMEAAYNDAARQVKAGTARIPQEVFQILSPVYVEDAVFRTQFAQRQIPVSSRTKKVIRYLFTQLERHLGGKELEADAPDLTIEHMLPENPGSAWDDAFPPEEQDRFIPRLANYTLLEQSRNREIKNETWPQKRKIYGKSAFLLTQEAAQFEEWTPETLARRADRLAGLATHVWRLDHG